MLCFASVAKVAWGSRGEWAGIDQILSSFIQEGKSCVTFTKSSVTWTMVWKTSSFISCFISFFNPYTSIFFVGLKLKGTLCLLPVMKISSFYLYTHCLSLSPLVNSFTPLVYCVVYISNPLSVGFQMKTCSSYLDYY